MDNQGDEDVARTRLPLHPRKAQELFFELLQVSYSEARKDQATAHDAGSLPSRVARFQQECAVAVKQLQRGQWLKSHSKDFSNREHVVQLRLSVDGKSLELWQLVGPSDGDEDEDSTQAIQIQQIELAAINAVTLIAAEAFVVDSERLDSDSVFASPFEAESEAVRRQVALAIVSALTAPAPAPQTTQLLWQAIRLRIFELSLGDHSVLEAAGVMQAAYEQIVARERDVDLPDAQRLFRLRSG